ncbi:hypothetical protein QYE76_019452 [Lolium multiflorum]|uniref:F-box domain-containing protein n=1 Tax=Lolium multiflorum TaxID=4521 RepID=A0AAD8R2Y3_LOLMU|nr:hypothetical protein QYE76_019452 [Lolium multiflorum]
MSDTSGLRNFADLLHGRPAVPKPVADDVTTRYHLFPEFPSKKAKSPFHMSDAGEIWPPPPLDDEDVLTEILCRLPPQPSSFLHASLTCKLWGRLVSSVAFRRRVRDHHRHAPIFGVYEKHARTLRFIPSLDAPDRIPPERFSLKVCADGSATVDNWGMLGCRHGRVLVINLTRRELLVFDPVSGDRHVIALPLDFVNHRCTANGAVVCCEDQGAGHFRVVLVGVLGNGGEVAARVYSSETGEWGELLAAPEPCRVGRLPCTMVGNGLYWWLAEPLGSILQFDFGTHSLTIIDKPPIADINIGCSRIIRGKDGTQLGLAVLSYPTLQIYDRQVGSHGALMWVLRKTLHMDKILGLPAGMADGNTYIRGYSEDAAAIVMSAHHGVRNALYIVHLESMKHMKIHGNFFENLYHPFANFYIGRL